LPRKRGAGIKHLIGAAFAALRLTRARPVALLGAPLPKFYAEFFAPLSRFPSHFAACSPEMRIFAGPVIRTISAPKRPRRRDVMIGGLSLPVAPPA